MRDGKVLLARRHPGDEHGGRWEFPGGGREQGETIEECLARELREELGIRVRVGEEVARVEHDYGSFSVDLRLFATEILAGRPRPLGCAEVRWVDISGLEMLDLTPADAKLVAQLREKGTLPAR